MMSGKQKRQALQLKRSIKKVGLEKALLFDGLKRGTIIAVDKTKIISRSAIPRVPDYYRDTCFICKSCGIEETWTTKQQQRWYEEQGGEIETKAVYCRACRRTAKLRREAARKVHFDGLAKKRAKEEHEKQLGSQSRHPYRRARHAAFSQRRRCLQSCL